MSSDEAGGNKYMGVNQVLKRANRALFLLQRLLCIVGLAVTLWIKFLSSPIQNPEIIILIWSFYISIFAGVTVIILSGLSLMLSHRPKDVKRISCSFTIMLVCVFFIFIHLGWGV
jgi:cytochrome bd-type quinol oxidase subunit 1